MVKPIIGVIGGSGICRLPGLDVVKEIKKTTKYGEPSAPIELGLIEGKTIAFLPRHGRKHTIPPHKVPYKANLSALKSLGVRHVVATCITGSLRPEISPGTLCVPDQFIDFTWGRDDSWVSGQKLLHLGMANPYCEHIRRMLIREISALGVKYSAAATVVVIQGPRFSTIAESKMFSAWGGDLINMTQYPECYFAKELGICYATIAAVTDYDVGIPSAMSMRPESMDLVLPIFKENISRTLKLLRKIATLSEEIEQCDCSIQRTREYYKSSNKKP